MSIPPITNPFSMSNENPSFKWMILVVTGLVFSITLSFSSFIKGNYTYQVGDIARENIKAPKELLINDTVATEEKKRKAFENVLTVYDYHDELVKQIRDRLSTAFVFARQELQARTGDETSATGVLERMLETKEAFESLLGITVSRGAYQILINERFSSTIEGLIGRITSEVLNNGVVANKEALLRERDRGVTLSYVGVEKEEVVYNLRHFYSQDQALSMVRIIGEPLLKQVDYTVKNLIVDFSQRLLVPNITLNASKTEQRRKGARENIKPVLYKINKGEMILRGGERVSQLDRLKLSALEAQRTRRDPMAISVGALIIAIFIFLVVYLRNSESHKRGALADNKNILFFATMLCLSFVATKAAYVAAEAIAVNSEVLAITTEAIFLAVPLASIAMIVCLFMDIELTASFALVLALCTAAIFENSFEIFIYSLLNMTMAAYWMQHCRERKVFIKAGVKLGLFNMALAAALNFYLADLSGVNLAVDFALAFSGGLLAGILTSGLAPLIEMVFDYTTDIKLLELSNLDQPLLRQLMLEAPGTYHHSLVVGAMAEAAASQIDANPLLARVCGYYHDIGKIKKPLYFIENQQNAKNKHSKLAPSMSGLILISHVKNGVEIAKAHRLGKPVIDTIQQHHGTRLISYFYEKAKSQQKEKGGKRSGKEVEVNLDDFRYPGPRPQSKEAGLVMLADSIEAAARTLESPSPSRIQKLMQDLINQTFSEGQLNDCELTLKDLNQIAKSFNTILSGIYHHRIEYPQQQNGKKKDGRSDRSPEHPSSHPHANGSDDSPGRLKRLGQS
jgi:cyclic-di-AMP phosphodiesterase PgpH